jgi:YbbR domain-containing protein
VGDYPVTILDAPEGISWSARPDSVELTIEAVEVIQSRVEVDLSGTPPNNLVVGSVRAEPEIVRLAAPARELAKVQRVRALFDQSQIKPGVAQTAIVEVLTVGNQALPSVRVIPETVELFAVAVPDVRRKRVPINVRWIGQLPFGLEIESFTVSPADADIRGEPEVLADIGVILTEPVDLSDVKANITKTVRLSAPKGVTLGGSQRTATVRIQVRKAAQPAPPPVDSGDSGNQKQNES